MRRPILSLFLMVLFAVAAVLMQRAAAAQGGHMVVQSAAACPVELSAAHRVDGSLLPAGRQGSGEAARPPADGKPRQSLDLSMKNTRLEPIVAADLEVHGTSTHKRILRAGEAAPAANAMLTDQAMADTVRHVRLVSSVPAEQSRTRAVSVDDLTSVIWISVVELQYADGSTWHAGPGRECRVEPDHVMLIANK